MSTIINCEKFPITRVIILLSITILLLASAITYNHHYQSIQQENENKRVESERLVEVLSDHVELTLTVVDSILKRVIERQYLYTLLGKILHSYGESQLIEWVNEVPSISAIVISDMKGNIQFVGTNRVYQPGTIKKIFSPHIRSLTRNKKIFPRKKLIVSTFEVAIDSDSRFIVMSRQLTGLNGQPTGIISALVDSSHITEFFHSIHLGKLSSMSLVFEDGTLLSTGATALTETKFLKEATTNTIPQKGFHHTILTEETLEDGAFRLLAFKHLANLPITFAILLHEDDIYAETYTELKNYGIFLGIFALFAVIVSFFSYIISKNIERARLSESRAIIASETKSDFLARMSHEFRTPLNAIIGFSELLQSDHFGYLNKAQKERLNDIHMCGKHLLSVVCDILEFSKGEAGKLTLCEEELNIAACIRTSLRIIAADAAAKKLTLEEYIPAESLTIIGDSRKIRQILLNLLSNAVKFTPNHGKITVSGLLDEHHNCIIKVTDTGIGIATADIPQALSVFGQVNRNKSHTPEISNQGTGLGLPLCKMFTQLHGGSLYISSNENVGTTVTITLPAKRVCIQNTLPLQEKEKPLLAEAV